MSLRKRRQGGKGLQYAIIAVVIIVVLVVGVGYYGGSIGLPHPLSGGSSGSSSANFSLSNATLSSYVSPDDGFTGLSANVVINNQYSQKMTGITVSINSLSMGQCSTLSGNLEIAAGATGTCKIGQNVNCNSVPTPPYAVTVTANFADGKSGTKSTTISSGLTTTC